MFQAVIGFHAVLAISLLLGSLLVGYRAGALAYRTQVGAMRQAAKFNMTLLAVVGVFAAGEASFIVYAGTFGWTNVRDSVLLFIPLIALPAAAIAIFALPRIMELARLDADSPEQPASRTKRRAAASGWLVVPVQSLAAGTMLYLYKMIYPMPDVFYGQLLLIGLVHMAAIGLLALRQSIKRRRIHRDDGMSAVHRLKRVALYAAAIVLLPFSFTYSVIEAKNERAGLHQARTELQDPNVPETDKPEAVPVFGNTLLHSSKGSPLHIRIGRSD